MDSKQLDIRTSTKTLTRLCLGLGILVLGVLSMPGCVSTTQQQIREMSTGLENDEVIAILRRDKISGETEKSFIQCLSERTSGGLDGLRVISDDEFVDRLFPWFEPRTAPADVVDLDILYSNERIFEALKATSVRYIVWIDGTTERTGQSGTVQCAVATGGIPACFGFLSWQSGSNYEAEIWDIDRTISVGKLSAESRGTSFVPALIVPLPFVARTQAHACASLSEQLKEFIVE